MASSCDSAKFARHEVDLYLIRHGGVFLALASGNALIDGSY
jgi:hypothetical protein